MSDAPVDRPTPPLPLPVKSAGPRPQRGAAQQRGTTAPGDAVASKPAPGRGRQRNRAAVDGRRRAVALTYDGAKMPAPTVSAIGHGLMADRIVELAKEHSVPVRSDPDLAALLSPLEVGHAIPPELYPLVAEVLAFVYRLKGRSAARKT